MSQVQISACIPAILTEVVGGFPQSLQANAGIVPQIMPLPLPSASFSIHHSPFISQEQNIIYRRSKLQQN
jgi:hypothetical protein